jgi:hypothetical protein
VAEQPRGPRPLRTAGAAVVAVGLVCGAVAWPGAGERGLVSALLGTVVVLLFFWSGLLPLAITGGQEGRAALGLGVLLLNYTVRLALALLALRGAERAELIDPRVLGLTIIVTTLTWAGAQVALLGRGTARV